jgi:hypothetical protein
MLEYHKVYVLLQEYTINQLYDLEEIEILKEDEVRTLVELFDQYSNFIELYNHL